MKQALRLISPVWSCLMMSSALVACTFKPKVTTEASPNIDKYDVRSVVVLPFQVLTTPQVTEHRPHDELVVPQGIRRSDMAIAVPPTGGRHVPLEAAPPPTAAEKVSRAFYRKLKQLTGLAVLSPDDAAAALKAMESMRSEMLPEQQGAKVASQVSADAALIGRVQVYQERKGSKLGGEGAAVGFEVKLVAADGTLLWTGHYYEKQKPLTEDAQGAIERAFMFVTADELIDYGVAKLIARFPYGAHTGQARR